MKYFIIKNIPWAHYTCLYLPYFGFHSHFSRRTKEFGKIAAQQWSINETCPYQLRGKLGSHAMLTN